MWLATCIGESHLYNVLYLSQIKPETLYLEEDISNHAEFPEDGKFHLPPYHGGRYKVCGDRKSPENEDAGPSMPGNAVAAQQCPMIFGWSLPRPWVTPSPLIPGKPSPLGGSKSSQAYTEPTFRRSLPYVSLCLDQTGRNIAVDTTIDNVYIKIPDNSVSVGSILAEVGNKVHNPAEQLTLLDSKYVPVSDDKGKLLVYYKIYLVLFTIAGARPCSADLEYWKVPSRRFYVTGKAEFEEIMKVKDRKRLNLRKRKGTYVEHTDDESVGDRTVWTR